MKRWMVAMAVCAGLLGAASSALASGGSASAVAGSSASKALNDFAVSFKVHKKDGKPSKVTDFNYGDAAHPGDPTDQVPMTCDIGPANTFSTSGFGPMKVKQGSFKGSFIGNGGSGTHNIVVKITGDFSHHNTQADGTLRVSGDFPPIATNCDTGKQTWKAGS